MGYLFNDLAPIKVNKSGQIRYPNVIKVNNRPVKHMFVRQNNTGSRKLAYDSGYIESIIPSIQDSIKWSKLTLERSEIQASTRHHLGVNDNSTAIAFNYRINISSKLIFKRINHLAFKSNLDDGKSIAMFTFRETSNENRLNVIDIPEWGSRQRNSVFNPPKTITIDLEHYYRNYDRNIAQAVLPPDASTRSNRTASFNIEPQLKAGYSLTTSKYSTTLPYTLNASQWIDWRTERVREQYEERISYQDNPDSNTISREVIGVYVDNGERKYINNESTSEIRNRQKQLVRQYNNEWRRGEDREILKEYDNRTYYRYATWTKEVKYSDNSPTGDERNRRQNGLVTNYKTLKQLNNNDVIDDGLHYTVRKSTWSNSYGRFNSNAHTIAGDMNSILGNISGVETMVIDKPLNVEVTMTNYLNGTDHQTLWKLAGKGPENITIIIDAPIYVRLREHDASEIFFTFITGATENTSNVNILLTNNARLTVVVGNSNDDIIWVGNNELNNNVNFTETMHRIDSQWTREKTWGAAVRGKGINFTIRRI